MKSKYELILEYLINDEEEKAKAIFHKMVVSNSKKIYESIMSEAGGDEVDDMIDDVSSDHEGVDGGDEFDDDEFGDEDGEDEEDFSEPRGDFDGESDEPDVVDLEDRIVDLEDDYDQLEAEFKKLMADHNDSDDLGGEDNDFGADEGESEGNNDEFDWDSDEPADDEGNYKDGDDFDGEDENTDPDEDADNWKDSHMAESMRMKKNAKRIQEIAMKNPKANKKIREYVEKITAEHSYDHDPAGELSSVNKRSPVARKNDMGGTTANIVRGGKYTPGPAPKTGQLIGKVQNTPGGVKKLSPGPKPEMKEPAGVNKKSIL